MFSQRLPWHHATNSIQSAVEARRASGAGLIDLTVSNPTAVGFTPRSELIDALAAGAGESYRPEPRGSIRAREALAGWLKDHGAPDADPDELFLTSSTSEAYGWILKLMCDPGDRVVRFTPTYPLLDHLCALEGTSLETIDLEPGGDRWHLPLVPGSDQPSSLRGRGAGEGSPRPTLGAIPAEVVAGSRLTIVVHPNNPTGHFLTPEEVGALSSEISRAGAALIADEVFFEQTEVERRRVATDSECLTFSLGGLSKSAALPHWKLGWIRVTGPRAGKARAIEALELIADTYLPVSSPVQVALPTILEHADSVRASIVQRVHENLALIDSALASRPSILRGPWEAGWSAVLRVPVLESEERLVLDLIESGVLVHPGYFYDFPSSGRLVLSLLTEPGMMRSGIGRICSLVG